MTMANSAVASPSRPSVSLRKTNKPLMEKKRRARINDSLSQLKSLVIQSSKKDSSQFSKLEKADILELTVKHLRTLQTQQSQQQQGDAGMASKYRDGFSECANEVIRYLGQTDGFSDDTKTRVVCHLASCLQLVNNAYPKLSNVSSGPAAPPAGALPMSLANTNSGAAAVLSAGTHPLPNRPIIQIVNAPFQGGVSNGPAPSLNFQVPPPVSNSHVPMETAPVSAPSQSAFLSYNQPLHIQIPPIVSPLLIQSKPAPQASHVTVNSQPIPKISDSNQQVVASKPVQMQDMTTCQSRVSVSSTSTSTFNLNITSTVPGDNSTSLNQSYSRTAQKKLHFGWQEDATPAKAYSTTSPSSSFSSSSESEMTSPLNLSQSPSHPSAHVDDNNNSNNNNNNSNENNNKQSRLPSGKTESCLPLKFRFLRNLSDSTTTTTTTPTAPPTAVHKENVVPNSTSLSPPSSHPTFTSVIVDGRRCLEEPAKYISLMLEDERQCMRHHGTPSPASSVGEERLWRPW